MSTKNIIKRSIHKIIDEMRCISHRIPVSVFKRIALELIESYPDNFEDRKSRLKSRRVAKR